MENDTTVELAPVMAPLQRMGNGRFRRLCLRVLRAVLALRERLHGRKLEGGVDDPVWLSITSGGIPIVIRLDPQASVVRPFQQPVAPELEPDEASDDMAYASPEHVEWVVGMLKAACASSGFRPYHPTLSKSWAYFQEHGPTWAAALAERAYVNGRLDHDD